MGSSSPGSPGAPVPSCAIPSPFWVGKATAKNNKRHKTRARRLPRFTPGGFGAKQKRNGNRNRGAGPRGGAAAAGARPAPPPAPGGILGGEPGSSRPPWRDKAARSRVQPWDKARSLLSSLPATSWPPWEAKPRGEAAKRRGRRAELGSPWCAPGELPKKLCPRFTEQRAAQAEQDVATATSSACAGGKKPAGRRV